MDDRDEWEKWRKVSNAVGIILFFYNTLTMLYPIPFYYHERNAPSVRSERTAANLKTSYLLV